MDRINVPVVIGVLLIGAIAGGVAQEAAPTYSAAQAARGKATYVENCAFCHGEALDDGEAPALAGPAFVQRWTGKSLDEPFRIMSTAMPPEAPGRLSAAAYADVLAYVLSENGVTAAAQELPPDVEKLKAMAVLP